MSRDPLKAIVLKGVLLLALWVTLIELVNGIMIVKFGFTYVDTLVRLAFFLIPMVLIIYVPVERGSIFFYFIVFILAHMFLRFLRTDIKLDAVLFDLQYTARSFLLLVSVALFGYSLGGKRLAAFLPKYFVIHWFVITVAICLQIFFDIGGMTYISGDQMREGYISFFVSGNQIYFLYVTSWWFLASYWQKMCYRIPLTIVTLLIQLAMGTRSGVVLVCAMSSLFVAKKIYDKSRVLLAVTLILSLVGGVLVVANFDLVMGLAANAFIKVSSESTHIEQNVNTYGALSALVSKRDILLGYAIASIKHYTPWEFLVGPNFFVYKEAMGSYSTGDVRMAEIDPVDLLGGFGILGLLVMYLPALWLLVNLTKRKFVGRDFGPQNRMFFPIQGAIFITLLQSGMSGHVFLAPVAVLTVGFLLSMASHMLYDEKRATALASDDGSGVDLVGAPGYLSANKPVTGEGS